eukprot:6195807-Pleurochrysis_carterae.AAC.4
MPAVQMAQAQVELHFVTEDRLERWIRIDAPLVTDVLVVYSTLVGQLARNCGILAQGWRAPRRGGQATAIVESRSCDRAIAIPSGVQQLALTTLGLLISLPS